MSKTLLLSLLTLGLTATLSAASPVVGKWTCDADKAPVEFKADGTIKYPWFNGKGGWDITDGTYTVGADGMVKYTTKNGGATLSGWFRYKDGTLTSPRGPMPTVTWSKVEEKK